jgi:hypothetical protein
MRARFAPRARVSLLRSSRAELHNLFRPTVTWLLRLTSVLFYWGMSGMPADSGRGNEEGSGLGHVAYPSSVSGSG